MTTHARLLRCCSAFTCWHSLLPAFPARIIIALRVLLGIACCAAFTLSPITSKSMHGQLLIGVGFIVAVKSTLGATIQTAGRLFLGGFIAAIYCLIIVNFFAPNVYVAVASTNIFVFLIVYTNLPIIVRRFSIVPVCIILLQWFSKPYVNTEYVLQTWAALTIAGSLAVLVTLIPIPVVPTAYRELVMRMQFIGQQTRREVTAIVLLISEYHNIHLVDSYNNSNGRMKSPIDIQEDGGIEMPNNSYRDDDFFDHSASFENLKDDHLLKSDIQDLHALVAEEIKQMKRASTELTFEPYFILLAIIDWIRDLLRRIPCFKNCITPSSTLEHRFKVWSTGLAVIHRSITGILSLDDHQRAFVGKRQMINAIALLLDAAFTFLDSSIMFTTSPGHKINSDDIVACRMKIEDGLEHFFEVYARVREETPQSSTSNSDSIRLNTFLLLVLRMVHGIITAAENSETPGARLEIGPDQTVDSPQKSLCDVRQFLSDILEYIGLAPSPGKFIRAMKTSLSVLISAVIVLTFRDHLQAYGWVYWAPMTTALVSDSSEGGTIRLSLQRLMAVLLGSTYAYIIVLITQDKLASGIFICLFVSLMGYIKTDSRREYFASVCAQSASIITFLSNQEDSKGFNKTVLARTSLTFLGIFIHVLISNLLLPISARELTKKKALTMIKDVSKGLKLATDDFCSFIGSNLDSPTNDANKTSSILSSTLAGVDSIADGYSALLEEALNEPNFWKRPFVEVKDRYDAISKMLQRIVLNIRFVQRCTLILRAETKLHFAQEAKWQMRRASLATLNPNNGNRSSSHPWTMTELRKQKQLQNDLDIPLTIFMTYLPDSKLKVGNKSLVSNGSSVSLRIANIALYQPVLEQIRLLEEHIQHVIALTGQLIQKQATVDVGSFELRQLYREDSFEGSLHDNLRKIRLLNRRPSFYPVPEFESIPMSKSRRKLCTCCTVNMSIDNQPLPSLRDAVDRMFAALVDFLYANNRFIRTELESIRSIGDFLAFHTLSYAFKDMVEATTNLAKNARRIKHIDTRALIKTDRNEKPSSTQHI